MKSALLIAHVLSVVLGVGGALLLDIYLIRHLRGAVIREQDVAFADYIEKFVKLGLIGVWASGIAILATAPDGPASVIQNPKVQAKLVIVVVLTLNALIIEGIALPTLRKNVHGHLFDHSSSFAQFLLLSTAAVSSASWLIPLVLGLARELNHVVPADLILITYAWLVISAAIATNLVVPYMYIPKRPMPDLADINYHAAARQLIEASFDRVEDETTSADLQHSRTPHRLQHASL